MLDKIQAALWHLAVSAIISSAVAALVFVIWFPGAYRQIAGGVDLWKLIVLIEMMLGPAMSLVIFNRQKTRGHLLFDYSIVGVVQLSALAFGLVTLYNARPLALVFVKDRFELVTVADFLRFNDKESLSNFSFFDGPVVVGVEYPEKGNERSDLLFDSIFKQRDIQFFPNYYSHIVQTNFALALKPASSLCNSLKSDVKSCLVGTNDWHWLPVSNFNKFWVGLVRKGEVEPFEFLPIDPWEHSLSSSIDQ